MLGTIIQICKEQIQSIVPEQYHKALGFEDDDRPKRN